MKKVTNEDLLHWSRRTPRPEFDTQSPAEPVEITVLTKAEAERYQSGEATSVTSRTSGSR